MVDSLPTPVPVMVSGSPQAEGKEALVLVGRLHWVYPLRPIMVSLLMLVFGISLISLSIVREIPEEMPPLSLYFTGLTTVIVALHGLFYILLSFCATLFVLTNKRIIFFKQRLFFEHRREEIELRSTLIIEAREHGIAQSLFRFGSLWFNNREVLTFVSHPHRVAKRISQVLGLT